MRFVDTSFWSAISGALLSTNHVIGEMWTFIRRRRGHADAVRMRDAVTASRRVTVVQVERDTEDEA